MLPILISVLKTVLSLIPALIYLVVIYFTVPYGVLSVRKMLSYLFCGVISVGLLLVFFRIFPFWQDTVVLPISIFGGVDDSRFIEAFIQIALLEEFSKFIGLYIGNKANDDIEPMAIMIYSGVVALGFSFIENVQYSIMYGAECLVVRSISTMILHLVCGLIIGYWVALGNLEPNKTRTILDVFLKKFNLRKVAFAVSGIFFAASIHGIFDFNLSVDSSDTTTLMILIIMVGVLITYICSRDLLRRQNSQYFSEF